MQVQSNRKELISIGLDKKEANIMRLHANDLFRSVSETIRLAVGDYIRRNKLEEKYAELLSK